jgi:hypothetical protein
MTMKTNKAIRDGYFWSMRDYVTRWFHTLRERQLAELRQNLAVEPNEQAAKLIRRYIVELEEMGWEEWIEREFHLLASYAVVEYDASATALVAALVAA